MRTSATVRAIGPSTGISWNDAGPSAPGIDVQLGTTPCDGFSEAMPQHVAGFRSEPPMSLPRPIGDMPAANADASPPDDPPAVRPGCHGLRVRPNSPESVCTRSAMSGQFVRPIGMAPACRIRSTTGESIGGMASASAGSPQLVDEPTRSMFCFTVHGTPCSGPSRSPAATARSAARAASRALSASTSVTACRAGLTASIRPRCASTTSTDVASPDAIIRASSPAPNCHSSPITTPFCVGRP